MATASLYLVAWPTYHASKLDVIPQNATELITDWEAGFEPERIIPALAPELLMSKDYGDPGLVDWFITDRVVEVDAINRRLLSRERARAQLARSLEAGECLLPSDAAMLRVAASHQYASA